MELFGDDFHHSVEFPLYSLEHHDLHNRDLLFHQQRVFEHLND